MDTLLVEIGSEEIPAGYIQPALDALAAGIDRKLTEARIDHGAVTTAGTPRRLVVTVAEVAPKQAALSTEMTGPPESVGFDNEGRPTVAAEKFAEKVGVSLKAVAVKETPKGRYLCARKRERGVPREPCSRRSCRTSFWPPPFPRPCAGGNWMYPSLARYRPSSPFWESKWSPLRWGTFAVAATPWGTGSCTKVKSRSPTRKPMPNSCARPTLSWTSMSAGSWCAGAIDAAAGLQKGVILPDDELLDINTNLVESVSAVAGRFSSGYLEIPDEVLITAMREHQKYFAVVDEARNLMPCFIAVNNTTARDLELVATGHERVLRARLEDARFFYRADLNVPCEERVEKLKGVLFQADLGSVYDKTQRIRKLIAWLAAQLDRSETFGRNADRAALLCKSDLVSQVVVEFPKLQGVMGRVYAAAEGAPEEVAQAIEEHYRPTSSGGKLPATDTGALLAIADKIDSICGCFALGLKPTGASDPYALRRQGIGLLQIMIDREFTFPLTELVTAGLELFGGVLQEIPDSTAEMVVGFLKNRLDHILAEKGFSKDVVAAVTGAGADNIPEVVSRVKALEAMRGMADFEPLAAAFKRVVNILRKSGSQASAAVDSARFEHDSESGLYQAFREVKNAVADDMAAGRFDEALRRVATLRPAVDAFFDGVMVLAEDQKLRENRLALLMEISGLFGSFADFSKLST
jgi:glycyl-tRNA synthetase beta chain